MLETNIDDMNSEVHSYLIPSLLEKGALDVFLTGIIMKKNRPGIKLNVLCNKKDEESLIYEILKQTTTFGIRKYEVERTILDREFFELSTKYGKVTMKKGTYNGVELKCFPEYEDCKKLAIENNESIINVYNEAIRKYMNNNE